MSKNFRREHAWRFPRLGKKKWRRPYGLQSKLRIHKGGAGMIPAVGYGTDKKLRGKIRGIDFVKVHTVEELKTANGKAILIGSTVGGKKTKMIYDEAKKLGLRVINMKKVKHAKRIDRAIEKNRLEKKENKKEKKEEPKTESSKETKTEKKETPKKESKPEPKKESKK
jgi:large subunit ribosomal protein L32e